MKPTKLVLNRKTYKEIKKYDHIQMSQFLEKYYSNGYNDGYKAGVADVRVDYDALKEALLKVKGIGEKKADDIITALKAGDEE